MAHAQTQPNPDSPMAPAAFHILLAVADGERHGYAIMQEVAALTHGAVRMGPGTLYTNIKRLAGGGLIEETEERPDPEQDDERRRYYRLTDEGRRALGAESQRLETLVEIARRKKLLPNTTTAS
jgi:DNA-binding PadR family transcriptional regulator